MNDLQPPITPGSGLLCTDWVAGPRERVQTQVVVSYTDFRAHSADDLQQIFATGINLSEHWPIMQGAVGLWLWGKPAELRGGSVSVWESAADLRRFVRWRVHTAIVKEWRNRIEVRSQHWNDERFVAETVWARAEEYMRAPREAPR